MVRIIGLAIAVAACWTCAPAQADVLSVETPSVSLPAAEQAVGTVAPVVNKVASSAPAAPEPAAKTLHNATTAAEPAVKAAVTTTTAQVAQRRAGDSGGLRVGASSLRRVPSARLRHPAPPRGSAPPARGTRAPHPAERPRDASAPAKGQPAAVSSEPGSPPSPAPAPRAEGGISAAASAGFAGGLAMLTVALILVAPRMRRILPIDPAALRPVAFVALLERPG